jgi:hypothetical protein
MFYDFFVAKPWWSLKFPKKSRYVIYARPHIKKITVTVQNQLEVVQIIVNKEQPGITVFYWIREKAIKILFKL